MKYSSKTGTLRSMSGDCAAVTVGQARVLARAMRQTKLIDANLAGFSDKPGQWLQVRLPAGSAFKTLIILGTGSGSGKAAVSASDYAKITDKLAERLTSVNATSALIAITGVSAEGHTPYSRALTLIKAVALACYRFDHYKTGDTPAVKLKTVTLLADERTRTTINRALRHGRALAAGLDYARDLGNQPPNICNPTYIAREARKLARKPNTRVTALDEKRMQELGMGAFIAVSQGSSTPGRMIVIDYRGGRKNDAPVALVGKGITFDTGGISLKPPPAMDEMKFDMCGAATVLGATIAAIEARLPINLVTVVAAAENMPSGECDAPGATSSTRCRARRWRF